MKLPCFYPVLDSELCVRRGLEVAAAAEAILAAGARILQLRHKGHFSRDVFAQAERIAQACSSTGAIFVVNDRADMAMLLAAGLHVGQDDLPPALARQLLGPERLLGYSTHNEKQLRAAGEEPVDYAAIGPIFRTASKQNPDPVVGLEELSRLRPLTAQPLVAIGGITRSNALDAIGAGADSVAILSDLFPRDASFHAVRKRAEEWMRLLLARK
ncbi:MAG: thiamine phosphate synthase [Bryobacteraceae bacterium]